MNAPTTFDQSGSRLLLDGLTKPRPPRDQSPSSQAIISAFCDMRIALAALDIPEMPVERGARHLEAIGGHLFDLAKAVDTYITVLGEELDRNSPCKVDQTCFRDLLADAIEGFADFEARRSADILARKSRRLSRHE